MTLQDFIAQDGGLEQYKDILRARQLHLKKLSSALKQGHRKLKQFADWHEFYGLHKEKDAWRFREWLPNATAVWLVGDFSDWKCKDAFELTNIGFGNWEGHFPLDAIRLGQQYRLKVCWNGGEAYRLPTVIQRIGRSTQDITRADVAFNAMVTDELDYKWRNPRPPHPKHALIYEAHIGMAQEEGKVGTFEEFRVNVLPRIAKGGYNVIQLMALAHHPYYASFGYHVTNFFTIYDQFGTPEELCRLIDDAHGLGICVTMDLVHSHAASNTNEGLSQLDGTTWQFFHAGGRGEHPAWGSRCFDYAKPEVLRLLLSNCRFWIEQYGIDGYRFDGITSMLYRDHGLGTGIWNYDVYFGANVDGDALAYLSLANTVIREVYPNAFTVAEDVSGFPGLCLPPEVGGGGFDCRLAMGITDLWFKLTDMRDNDWSMGTLWYELNAHRPEEHTISYVESHDQALVGGKTFAFTLIGARMYDAMGVNDASLEADRMMALHKMARLITFCTSDAGYLNFMGNEFGHPEWIDFPGAHNGWSFSHSRRQWSLADDPNLRFKFLRDFDVDMLALAKLGILDKPTQFLMCDEERKLLAFERNGYVFCFNFSPDSSYSDLKILSLPGEYIPVLDTDRAKYGGFARIEEKQHFFTQPVVTDNHREHYLSIYLPSRTALVLKRNK